MTPQDEAEIRNLIGRLARLTDKWSKPDDYLDNCTADIIWQMEGMPAYEGRNAMRCRMQEMLETGVCGPGIPTRHHVTSIEIIAGPDADEARVLSFILMTGMIDGAPNLLGYGDYHDVVRREDGSWRLASRLIHSAWTPPATDG